MLTRPRPLIVDLDRTLCRTDTFVEALLALLAIRPWAVLRHLPLLARGRAAFKVAIGREIALDPAGLVFNEAVLALARAARAEGRPVLLVTASDAAVARAMADHAGVFDEAQGSDGVTNLKGDRKAAWLVERYGQGGFDYVGDSEADLAVWRVAGTAHVVAPSAGLLRRARGVCADVRIVEPGPPALTRLRLVARALRVHQWAKNVLIFLPLLAGHVMAAETWLRAVIAFAAFSLCASSVYVMNDVLDLPHDRAHPRKRRRPFASGALDPARAPPLILTLLAGAIGLTLGLPGRFGLVLALYYACTLAYSLGLKRLPIWDVIMLACLYALRVLAGGAATGVEISPWLLAFSLFLFFSLAVVKRLTELVLRAGEARLSGRGYGAEDMGMLRSMAASSGYMAVLVIALYADSPAVRRLYPTPLALWGLCPLLLAWISRVLMLANRGEMHDDPVVFALRDRVSIAIGVACAGVILVGVL